MDTRRVTTTGGMTASGSEAAGQHCAQLQTLRYNQHALQNGHSAFFAANDHDGVETDWQLSVMRSAKQTALNSSIGKELEKRHERYPAGQDTAIHEALMASAPP